MRITEVEGVRYCFYKRAIFQTIDGLICGIVSEMDFINNNFTEFGDYQKYIDEVIKGTGINPSFENRLAKMRVPNYIIKGNGDFRGTIPFGLEDNLF